MHGISKDWPLDALKNYYLNRYAWPGPLISDYPTIDTELIVVIPCYNEPDVLDSLLALDACTSPNCGVEIIIVVNHGENETEELKKVNHESVRKIESWINTDRKFQYHLLKAFDLPSKKAGVGLARKIGMDEAVRRFEILNSKKGIIVCFDADCLCSQNYLFEIRKAYKQNKSLNAALVYFEHDIENLDDPQIENAITNYELHLRYYVQAMKYAHFPFAYHTVGSCITVSSEIYQKQGGMNLRKAGEDFYFLQKVFPLGNIQNINTAKVIPSSRPSQRVPFGTGKAVGEMLKTKTLDYKTYHPLVFSDFKNLNVNLGKLWESEDIQLFVQELPKSLRSFLGTFDFDGQVLKIKRNCNNKKQFIKSFYAWFNGFKALKYVHFARDHFYENIEILDAAKWMVKEILDQKINSKKDALDILRQLDRSE